MSGESIKTKAVVCRSSNTGENDKMLTLLSAELGKISVIAKGVRSLKHKSRGGAGVLCYSDFVLKKIKDGLYSLVSAELIEGFRPLSERVELLSAGNYFANLTEICVMQGTTAADEISLLLNALYMLGKRPDSIYLIKAVFEIKLCELLGIMPEFQEYCPCGEKATHFCISDGEMRCDEHKTSDCISLTPGVLNLACYISENSLRDSFFAMCSEGDAQKLSTVTEPFLQFHLGKLPNSLSYFYSILKNLQ